MSEKHLVFYIDNNHFSFNLKYLREVVHDFEIQKMPQQSDFVSGLVNIRGEVLGVYDLNYIIKKVKNNPEKRKSCIAIIEHNSDKFGVLFDNPIGVELLEEKNWTILGEEVTSQYDGIVTCLNQDNKKLIFKVNIDKLIEKKKLIKKAA